MENITDRVRLYDKTYSVVRKKVFKEVWRKTTDIVWYPVSAQIDNYMEELSRDMGR